MHKSLWTGRSSEKLISLRFNDEVFFVEPENREKLEGYLEFSKKWQGRFLGIVVSLSILTPLLAIMAAEWTIGFALLALAIVFMILPLPTPQTLRLIGAQKSILIVRIIALAIAVLGLSLLLPK